MIWGVGDGTLLHSRLFCSLISRGVTWWWESKVGLCLAPECIRVWARSALCFILFFHSIPLKLRDHLQLSSHCNWLSQRPGRIYTHHTRTHRIKHIAPTDAGHPAREGRAIGNTIWMGGGGYQMVARSGMVWPYVYTHLLTTSANV